MLEVDLSAFPLNAIEEAFDQGKLLDAYQLAVNTGIPLVEWPSGLARRTAAMICYPLGDERKGRVLDELNWRQNRSNPDFFLHSLFSRSVWTPAYRQIPRVLDFLPSVHTPKERANLLAYLAGLYNSLRQHQLADQSIAEAISLDPSIPWLHVQKASLLASRDLYQDALDTARHALSLDRLLRPSILQVAELLKLLNRTDEAIQLLLDSHHQTQHPAYVISLQAIYSEREDHQNALWCLDQALPRLPLINKEMRQWIAGRRADFLYLAGDYQGFLAACDEKNENFHKIIAENYRRPGASERRRVKLNVPFIRQHRMTCAPATLASLSAFWNQPHDHLTIAEAICRDGTPSEKQIAWAQQNGFIAREFRVTPEVTRALIDRGIPFTLTTRWSTGAHLQACIGYDDRLDVLILRDPTLPHYTEWIFSKLLESHPVDGPRGMTFIPQHLSHLLDGIELPDEALYAAQNQLFLAIENHDQAAIRTTLEEIRRLGPDRPITHSSTLYVASYFRDWQTFLTAVETLLEKFPTCDELILRKAQALNHLERRQEHLQWLEHAIQVSKDPVFLNELGEALIHDARQFHAAEPILRRAIRYRRGDGQPYASLAQLLLKQLRPAEAWTLFSYASTLAPDQEHFAALAFDAARTSGKSNEGLTFLAHRCATDGLRNPGPWITHARCLAQLNRFHDASQVLHQARQQLPNDGTLLSEGGSMMIHWGPEIRTTGIEWLLLSKPLIPTAHYHRLQTRALSFLGHRKEAIQHAQQLVTLQPLDDDAWRILTNLSAEELGEKAAVEPLLHICRQYPQQLSLWTLLASWQSDDNDFGLPTLDHVLTQDPQYSQARIERIYRRLRAHLPQDALADSTELLLTHPFNAASHVAHGFTLKALNRESEAFASFRQALIHDVDNPHALHQLIQLAGSPKNRIETLHFIHQEILRQVTFGNAITTYQELAWPILDPDPLLSQLTAIAADRPDLWASWVAIMNQALAMKDFPKALDAAETLTSRFPLVADSWVQRAQTHHLAGQQDLEEAALRRALELIPAWDQPARQLANLLERTHRTSEAETVLRRTIDLTPLSSANYQELAHFLHRNHQTAEALNLLHKACELFPFDPWCWELRAQWSPSPQQRDTLRTAILSHLERFRQRIPAWQVAANTFDALGLPAETIRILREANELFPDNPELAERLAGLYCDSGDLRSAWSVCENAKPTLPIRGRKAHIRYLRGETKDAIADTQAILEQEPDYQWGLRLLASWLETSKNWQDLHQHSQKWLRFYPHSPLAHAYLGHAAKELARPTEAYNAFLKAFQLDPSYHYVGTQLMQLHLEGHQLDQALETLQLLRRFAAGPQTEIFATRLALRDGRLQDAVNTAYHLLEQQNPTIDQIDSLKKSLTPPALKSLLSLTHKSLRRKDHPTCAKWVFSRLGKGIATVLKQGPPFLQSLPADAPGRTALWAWLLELATQDKDTSHKLLPKWLKHHRQELSADPSLWLRTSYALIQLNLTRLGADWLKDWTNRPDANGAIAINYSICIARNTKSPAHASEASTAIHLQALERFPHDRDAVDLHASCSLHLLAANRIEEARHHFDAVTLPLCSNHYANLARIASAYFHLLDGHQDPARNDLRTAIPYFKNQLVDHYDHDAIQRTLSMSAQLIPETQGKVAKLLKLWGLPAIKPAKRGPRISKTLVSALLIIAYIIIRTILNTGT